MPERAEGGPRRAWRDLAREIVGCEACPRLRSHCVRVAAEKKRAYRDQEYWGRPVPGFGDPGARVLLVGLAPAAHGANRTGRMFTGDRSGDFLYAALHRAGLSNRGVSVAPEDGLALRGAFVTAVCRCAPPANRPEPEEMARCARFLEREIALLARVRAVVALGGIAWDAIVRLARRASPQSVPRPRPAFRHGAECRLVLRAGGGELPVLGCYHPSQQNTLTGKLTPPMLDTVLARAVRLAES